ncbi:MAG: ATP-binding cassette domain-containing protein [Albidovulum sp.]
MSGSPSIVDLTRVSKFFGPFKVLDGINLSVGTGERVVVCGPSGSGKSTMIRCINRPEEHDVGRIVVDGLELGEDTQNIRAVRQDVCMVFQQFNRGGPAFPTSLQPC